MFRKKQSRKQNQQLPWPDGPLGEGKRVSSSGNPMVRLGRVRYATAITLLSVLWRMPVQADILAAMHGGQSFTKKLERMRAAIVVAATDETYSPENVRRLGLREADCTCPPGEGHRHGKR